MHMAHIPFLGPALQCSCRANDNKADLHYQEWWGLKPSFLEVWTLLSFCDAISLLCFVFPLPTAELSIWYPAGPHAAPGPHSCLSHNYGKGEPGGGCTPLTPPTWGWGAVHCGACRAARGSGSLCPWGSWTALIYTVWLLQGLYYRLAILNNISAPKSQIWVQQCYLQSPSLACRSQLTH